MTLFQLKLHVHVQQILVANKHMLQFQTMQRYFRFRRYLCILYSEPQRRRSDRVDAIFFTSLLFAYAKPEDKTRDPC